jgi:His/Glu/Gln/Arg/opine family amino acid ABC transporter permease subunit
MAIDWDVVLMAIPLLARGALITLGISACAIVLGMIGGLVLGLVSLSGSRIGRGLVAAYVDFVRGTPLLIQIFLIFFVLPLMGMRLNEIWAGIVALAFNATGYIAEIVRGTVGSVERGQAEAARSIGLTEPKILVYVLLPQAFRPMLPALTNELITLVKNSSLLSVISVYELTRAGQAIITTYFVPLEIYVLLALYYYVIITALARLSRLIERRLPVW